jgi:N6-L-threonylcarbamoyladenine synthase
VLPPDAQHLADFSFSGLKSAVLRHVQQRATATVGDAVLPPEHVADVCATFQRVVVETLLDRTFETAHRLGARSIGISGGVSANSRLRRDATARGQEEGVPVYVPALSLSTDNAAMIAAAGLRRMERGQPSDLTFNAHASLGI